MTFYSGTEWQGGRYTPPMVTSHEGEDPAAESATEMLDRAYRALAPVLREVSVKKFRIPPADAEAVVNTVFEAYLRRRSTVRNLEHYLVASVCNASRDYWRARKNLDPMPEDAGEYMEPTTGDAEERLVRRLTIVVTLRRLGKECCDALYLFHLGGFSAQEIAQKLQTTEQNAWQILSKCRRHARTLLAGLARAQS